MGHFRRHWPCWAAGRGRRMWAYGRDYPPKPAATSRNGPGDDRNRSARSRRERAVLTNRPAKTSASTRRLVRGLVRGGVAIAVATLTLTSVYAGGVGTTS